LIPQVIGSSEQFLHHLLIKQLPRRALLRWYNPLQETSFDDGSKISVGFKSSELSGAT